MSENSQQIKTFFSKKTNNCIVVEILQEHTLKQNNRVFCTYNNMLLYLKK